MKAPATPTNEPQRLDALAEYSVLDTAAEPAFDALTRLAAEILGVPITLISLIDVDRQWFKSRYGLAATQTPRNVSFCGHVVASETSLVVPDAFLDDRFADNPLVTGAPHVRFYAGMPLKTPEGFVLGTLCAIDVEARTISPRQLSLLELLSQQVMELLELRRRSRMLREFQATLDGTQDGILIFEPDTLRFRYANRGASAQTGYSRAELLTMSPLALKPNFDEASYRRLLAPMLAGKQPLLLFETTHRHKQGREIPVEVMLQYMAPEEGPAHFINIVRDISERKKLDQQKDQFVATVSHELRTPLTAIRGALGLVAGGVTGELPLQAQEYVGVALAGTDRLMHLVGDLLDLEQVRSKGLTLQPKATPLGSVVESAISSSQPLAQSLGIELAVLGEPSWPDVLVDGDRLLQVLTNLISNALKFSARGQRIELQLAARGPRARLEVCDHGPGIPDSFRPRVFERFAQAEASDGRRRNGSGLGLSISKALIEGMNGEIGFFDTEGSGATFFIELPLVPMAVTAAPLAAPLAELQ